MVLLAGPACRRSALLGASAASASLSASGTPIWKFGFLFGRRGTPYASVLVVSLLTDFQNSVAVLCVVVSIFLHS